MIFDGIRVYITFDDKYSNSVKGLCGNFNYMIDDEFMAANNMIELNIMSFADSYKLDLSVLTPNQTNPCEYMVN